MATAEGPSLATVLFTDLVGSTAIRASLGEERADELRKAHDQIVGACIEARGGRVIRGLGDGLMAAFASASDALTAAVEAQQALVEYGRRRDAIAPLPVRMGLSVGDVSWDAGDCFGTPVVEAARLVAEAGGGQILCSDFVRAMARGRGGRHFTDLGFFELKGLPDPLAVCEVGWIATEAAPGEQLPFPAELVTHSSFGFVGRDDDLATAESHLDAAPGLSFLWLVGEPGIGKTRLAAEIARRAHAAGADVLAGRCDVDLVVPFHPFVTALRHVVEECSADHLPERLGRHVNELVRLAPELASLVPGVEAGTAVEPEVERYRLFDALRSWLTVSAEARRLLVVLDDIQWADGGTVGVLVHLAQRAVPVPLRVVATLRDTEVPPDLQRLLDDLAARSDSKILTLSGLPEAGVSQLVEAAAGPKTGDTATLARRIHAETAGNPLFVAAVLSGLEGGEEPVGLPTDVVAAVRRRVVRLSGPTQELVRIAALCGLEFDPRVLSAVLGENATAVLDGLDEGRQARLVEETGVNRYRFAHALVRDVLRQQVGPSRAAQRHQQIAEALEALHRDHLDDHVAELAFHFGEAVAAGGSLDVAVGYIMQAAELAGSRYAADTAAGHYRRVVELLEEAQQGHSRRHCEALVRLGESLRHAGQFDEAQDTLRRAVVEAAVLGWPELRAEAAVQFDSAMLWTGGAGDEAAGMLREAESHLPGTDTPLRASVLLSLGRALGHSTRADAAVPVLERAIAMARRLGDQPTLVRALMAVNQSLVGPRYLPWRAEATDEARTIARGLGDRRLYRDAIVNRGIVDLELGQLDSLRVTVDEEEALRREVPDPAWAYENRHIAATAALLGGRLDDAERLADEALELGRGLRGIDPEGIHGVQMFSVRREQGRLGEVAPALTMLARLDFAAAWRPGLAALYTELEMEDEARLALEALVTEDEVRIASDVRRAVSLSYLAEAAAFVRDRQRVSVLYRNLEPYAGSWISMHVIVCYGPATRYLGLLAAVDPARDDDARAHLEDALARSEASGSPLWSAHAAYDLGALLAGRGGPADAARAEALARTARDAAVRLGMAGLERRAERLLTMPRSAPT